MSTVSVIYDLIGRDNASRAFDSAARSAGGLETSVRRAGMAVAAAGGAIAAGAVAIATESVKAAADFQASMEKIHTQAGAPQSAVDSLTKSVLALAPASQQGPQQLSEALYHLKSVGMDNADAMKALKQASDLAAVGGANLEDTTNALAGAWRSGIRGAQSFSETASTVNAIIGAGNMKMEDFVAAIGTGILPAAKTFGVSLSSVGSALALMTDEGVPAVDAATRLRMSLSLMGAPSAAAEKALKKIGLTGYQLGQTMRGPQGIVGAVELLSQHLKASGLDATKQAQVISEAFGGGRSSSAIMTMLNNLTVLEGKQKQINDTTGNYGAAVAAQRKTASAQFALLRSAADTLGIRLGLDLLPPVTKFVQFISKTAVPAVEGFTKKVASLIPVKTIESDVNTAIGFVKGLFGIGASSKPVKVPAELSLSQLHASLDTRSLGPAPVKVPAIMSLSQLHAGMDARSLAPVTAPVSSGIGGAIEKAFGNLGTSLTTALAKVDWAGIGKRMGSALGSAITAGLAGAGEFGQKIIDALGRLDWVNIGKKVGGNALGFAIGFIGNLGAELFSPSFWEKHWWDTIIAVISLFGVGKIAGPLLKIVEHIPVLRIFAPLLRGLEKLAGPVDSAIGKVVGAVGRGLLDGFTKVFPGVGGFLEREGGLLATRLGVAGLRVGEAAVRLARGIGDGILKGARALGSVIGRVIGWILLPFAKAGGWLVDAGVSVFRGLLAGIGRGWSAVAGWLARTGSRVLAPFAKAGSWLAGAGMSVLRGFLGGLGAGWRAVAGWLGGVYGRTLGYWIKANVWLLQKGTDLLLGLLSGIGRGWRSVAGWLGGAGGRVVSYFAKAGTWLISHGSAIISGLYNGIRSAIKGVGSWVKSNIVDPLVNWVKHWFGIHSPSTVMAGLGSHLMSGLFKGMMSHDLTGMAKLIFGSLPDALGSLLEKGLVSLTKLPGKALSALSSLGGKIAGFFSSLAKGGGGGTGQWAPYVLAALAMNGLPLSLEGQVLYQMQTESGGNPNAVNLSDINAMMGMPSQGLMQVIPPTFTAYHVPGTSNNIRDPLANIAAAINYAKHVYGPTLMSNGMGIGSGHGYAAGTPSARRGWAWVGEGGVPELVHFNGGEQVGPVAARARGGDGGTTLVFQPRSIVINAPAGNGAQIGRQLAEYLKEFQRGGGKITP